MSSSAAAAAAADPVSAALDAAGVPQKRKRFTASKKCMVRFCPYFRRVAARADKKHLFRFPKHSKRLCWEWIHATRNPNLAQLGPQACADNLSFAICQDHFDYKCFCSGSRSYVKLTPDAVPTLNLVLRPPPAKQPGNYSKRKGNHEGQERRFSEPTTFKWQMPPARNGQSFEEYQKIVETYDYMNKTKLTSLKNKSAPGRKITLVRISAETGEPLGEGEDDDEVQVLEGWDEDEDVDEMLASCGVRHVSSKKKETEDGGGDLSGPEECLALLEDDPPRPSTSCSSPPPKRSRPGDEYLARLEKERDATKFGHRVNKPAAAAGSVPSNLLHDDALPAALALAANSRSSATTRLPPLRTAADQEEKALDLQLKMANSKSRRKAAARRDPRDPVTLAALDKVVESIRGLIQVLRPGASAEPDGEDPVCMEVHCHTMETKFEIDIQCGAGPGKHRAKMMAVKQ